MRHELTVPLSENFYLDAGSAGAVRVILKEREDINVVIATTGPRFEETANQATLDGFEEEECSFPRGGVGNQLIIPPVNHGGVIARWRPWSRAWEGMSVTVTIPRDVRFTATTRFGITASTKLLDVGMLYLLEDMQDRRVPLDPEKVTGMFIYKGRVHLEDSSSYKEL